MSSSVVTPRSEGHMVSPGGDVADRSGEVDAHSIQEERGHAIVSQEAKEESGTGVYEPQSDREGSVSAITREDVLQTPDSSVSISRSGQIGNTSFAIRERVLNDGYNWRKYGQKNVKGSEYIRSYYRCTHPTCLVKKHFNCSSEGKVTETVYFGHHNHPKPQQDLPVAVGFAVSIVEGKPDDQPSNKSAEGKSPSQLGQPLLQIEPPVNHEFPTVVENGKLKDADACLAKPTRTRDEADNENDSDSKPQKKRKGNVEAIPVDRYAGEHRAVVQTVSDLDIVNDGYRWRKYGQKMVKGTPHPRSYYRCSSPGCPVRKHVERASHDPKVVVATYEGTHDHDMPPLKTVNPKAAGVSTFPTPHTRKRDFKSEECDVHSLSESGHSIMTPETKVIEPQNGQSVMKLEHTDGPTSGMVSSSPCCGISLNECQTDKLSAEGRPNEQQSCFSSKNGDVGSKTSAQSSAGLDSGLSGQLNNKSRESDVFNVVSVVRPVIEGNCNDQQRANSEALKS